MMMLNNLIYISEYEKVIAKKTAKTFDLTKQLITRNI